MKAYDIEELPLAVALLLLYDRGMKEALLWEKR